MSGRQGARPASAGRAFFMWGARQGRLTGAETPGILPPRYSGWPSPHSAPAIGSSANRLHFVGPPPTRPRGPGYRIPSRDMLTF